MLPHFLDNRFTDGGEVIGLTLRPPFTPRKIPGIHFCYRLSRPLGHSAAGRISCYNYHYYYYLWDGVRLSSLGTSAINEPIVPAPNDDNDDEYEVSLWNENWKEKPTYSEKTCPSDTLPTKSTNDVI
jgi:hypothetical protein